MWSSTTPEAFPAGRCETSTEIAWRRGWELKVFSYINLTRAMDAAMEQRGGGVILINISNGGQNYAMRSFFPSHPAADKYAKSWRRWRACVI